MHAETLAYLLHQLPHDRKEPRHDPAAVGAAVKFRYSEMLPTAS